MMVTHTKPQLKANINTLAGQPVVAVILLHT